MKYFNLTAVDLVNLQRRSIFDFTYPLLIIVWYFWNLKEKWVLFTMIFSFILCLSYFYFLWHWFNRYLMQFLKFRYLAFISFCTMHYCIRKMLQFGKFCKLRLLTILSIKKKFVSVISIYLLKQILVTLKMWRFEFQPGSLRLLHNDSSLGEVFYFTSFLVLANDN